MENNLRGDGRLVLEDFTLKANSELQIRYIVMLWRGFYFLKASSVFKIRSNSTISSLIEGLT